MIRISRRVALTASTASMAMLALALSGCGDDKAAAPANTPPKDTVAPATPATPPTALKDPVASARKILGVGSVAPTFSLPAHDGSTVDLAKIDGPVVLYFYPKDETPG